VAGIVRAVLLDWSESKWSSAHGLPAIKQDCPEAFCHRARESSCSTYIIYVIVLGPYEGIEMVLAAVGDHLAVDDQLIVAVLVAVRST
jgi:hypothetical protein